MRTVKTDKIESLLFAGLIFRGLTKEILLEESDTLKFVITVNAEFIVKANENERFKDIINSNYAAFDGQIPYIIAKSKYKGIRFEKISGSDFIYDACKYAEEHNKKIFLLGGYPDSNKLAAKNLRKMFNIKIEGFSPPFEPYPFDKKHNDFILEHIIKFKPDFLFVGFGAPKQEFWIDDNKEFLENTGVKLAVGSGGTFEMVSGKFKRAPKFIQKMGLERLWRFIIEPKLFRLKGILTSLKFFYYVR